MFLLHLMLIIRASLSLLELKRRISIPSIIWLINVQIRDMSLIRFRAVFRCALSEWFFNTWHLLLLLVLINILCMSLGRTNTAKIIPEKRLLHLLGVIVSKWHGSLLVFLAWTCSCIRNTNLVQLGSMGQEVSTVSILAIHLFLTRIYVEILGHMMVSVDNLWRWKMSFLGRIGSLVIIIDILRLTLIRDVSFIV